MTPAALVDDLVEEILLRLPPDDPAQLVRASLVCKRWRRLVSDTGFRRSLHKFHRSPPMLGFFCRADGHGPSHRIRFVPTSTSCPPIADHRCYRVLDSRHGRVLLLLKHPVHECELAVWDPITGDRRDLPTIHRSANTYNASVLCGGGTSSCDRQTCCHCKQFLVVFIGNSGSAGMFACFYSSQSGSWSEPTSLQAQCPPGCIDPVAGVLAGNAVYFQIRFGSKILKYDLGTKAFSVIDLPPSCYWYGDYYNYIAPMATKDGGLGFVGVEDTRLHLWSWKTDRKGQERWVESRTIRLKKLIPVDPVCLFLMPDFVAFADGARLFLLVTTDGIFSIDLKTFKVRKVYEDFDIKNIVPFVSFYTPALGETSSGDGQIAGA
ncbi:unnamed protein product [Urochloa decumbens]|uniref:F-box domain-containing protein n=1 Tax=Urochloa decumbens TaxID=240449 RepID=A0ABC9G7T2_9POAL